MRTIFDFAEEYKDISFSDSDVTEADNAIFCRLSYLNFNGFQGRTIKYTADHFEYTDESELSKANKNMIKTEDLLKLLGQTERYANIVIADFRECDDDNSATAFSAVVFRLTENISYIAYRGTDDKILSFYEDAELAYSFPITAQLASLSYTNYLLKKHEGSFILGGHSKGGNLAMFSFMFTNDENKKRITAVYNNDGPGFPKEFSGMLFTDENCSKIINLLPEDSIVGRLLELGGEKIIVKSTATAVGQHNLFTWITDGGKFERADDFSMLSDYVDDTLTESLEALSPKDLKKTVNAMYSIAKSSGLNTLDDINRSNYANILLSVLQNHKSENSAGTEAGEIIKTLSKSLINSVDIENRLPEIDVKRLKEIIDNKRNKSDS